MRLKDRINPGPKLLIAIFFIIAAGLFAYRKALDNFFYGDDFGFISEARAIHLFRPAELWQGIISIIQPSWFRVEFIFFFINNILESLFGLNPFLYHLHNLLLHITACGFVYAIILKITGVRRVSFLASLFFLLNPLSSETVYWYTGAHTLYVAYFIILTLWCYAYSYRKLSVLFLALAMCTKPEASVLLLYIALIDICLFGFSSIRETKTRLQYHILASIITFIVYALYYRNAATWPIPEHRFQFQLTNYSLEQVFKNLSYLIIPIKKLYYLAMPLLFLLFFLNLNSKEKRLLLFGLGFLFLSILPYQLFIIDPNGFYFSHYETVRYFYLPALGWAFLIAAVLMIALTRINSVGQIAVYASLGWLLFFNLAALGKLDRFFEEREHYYKLLVKGVTPYFKNNPDKFLVLFNFPSFADPVLTSFYTSDFPLISEMFFNYKLFSVSELKSLPDSAWIKEKYAALPASNDVVMLEFKGEQIIKVSPEDKEACYRNFLNQAGYLYQ